MLVEEAIPPGDLDTGDLRERAKRAEESAREAEEGSEEQARCLRDKRRAEAFLRIAESGSGR